MICAFKFRFIRSRHDDLFIIGWLQQDNYNEATSFTEDAIQTSESKSEIIESVKNENLTNIEALISNHFPFVDSVVKDNSTSNIYGTDQFSVEELANLLAETVTPEEKSEYIDQQQILIYPDHFIVLKDSEEVPGATIIEVASDEFVRNHYSPNFLSTYFAIRILDDVLDVDDWAKKRRRACSSGDCYGGYSTYKRSTTNRGMSSVRGGGPSAGK